MTLDEEQHFQILAKEHDGGLPLQATFWKQKLLKPLHQADHLLDHVKKTLIRLYEAPKQQRLALLDLITAQQHGLR